MKKEEETKKEDFQSLLDKLPDIPEEESDMPEEEENPKVLRHPLWEKPKNT